MHRTVPTLTLRAARGIATCGSLVALTLTLGFSAGCGEPESADVGAARESEAAVATLAPTEDQRVQGTVKFQETRDALRVHAELSGLKPGEHGFHVHQKGDCSAPDASSAGPHFDFEAESGEPDHITGNLGELTADASGHAVLDAVVPHAELHGERSILGRAVVVHERGNDPKVVPDGNAGARVACGVITSLGVSS